MGLAETARGPWGRWIESSPSWRFKSTLKWPDPPPAPPRRNPVRPAAGAAAGTGPWQSCGFPRAPPTHGPRRAEPPHRAPASGDDPEAHRRVRVTDSGWRKPLGTQGLHPLPVRVMLLTAAPRGLHPHLADFLRRGASTRRVAAPGFALAASRTRSHALRTIARHRVRCAVCPRRFPWANALSSTASAGSFEPLG